MLAFYAGLAYGLLKSNDCPAYYKSEHLRAEQALAMLVFAAVSLEALARDHAFGGSGQQEQLLHALSDQQQLA